MRAERICALSRHVIALSFDTAMTAAHAVARTEPRRLRQQAHRRARGLPRGRRGPAPARERRSAGLVVHPDVCRRRLEAELPFLATEEILMEAVRRGGDRQQLHERLRAARAASSEKRARDGEPADLLERIAARFRVRVDARGNGALRPAPRTPHRAGGRTGRDLRARGARSRRWKASPRRRRRRSGFEDPATPPAVRVFIVVVAWPCGRLRLYAARRSASPPRRLVGRSSAGWTEEASRPGTAATTASRKADRVRRDLRLLSPDRGPPGAAARHGRGSLERQNGQSVRVRINDRGPFIAGRIIDLSRAAAGKLGPDRPGHRPRAAHDLEDPARWRR